MVAIIVEVLYSCQTVGKKLYLDLVAFSILPYGKAFTGESARQVTGKELFVAITPGHKIVSSGSRTRGIFVIAAFSCRVPVS